MLRSMLAAGISVLIGAQDTGAQNAGGAQRSTTASPAGEIRGKVVEARTSASIRRASITVREKGGTAVVAGAIAASDGGFRLQGLRTGVYTVRATYIGFAPRLTDVSITDTSPIANVDFELARVAVKLTAISVAEERAAV